MTNNLKKLEEKEAKTFQTLSDLIELDKMERKQRENFLKILNEYVELHIELEREVASTL